MPYDIKRFIFSVSLCAILAVNPVLATAPTNDEELGTTHDVYVESTLNQATNGIAGVSYVNRMVNAAGNAATAAEAHAAAAGAYALSAAQSADEAHKVLADKVSIDQGEMYSGFAMVIDNDGNVAPGYITNGMLADGAVTADKVKVTCYGSGECVSGNLVMLSNGSGQVEWGKISSERIYDSAVTAAKIANGAVTSAAIADGSVVADDLDLKHELLTGMTGVLLGLDNNRDFGVVKGITQNYIAPGAVPISKIGVGEYYDYNLDQTIAGAVVGDVIVASNGEAVWSKIKPENTEGVVGMVPVGSADATTYGQFWIE